MSAGTTSPPPAVRGARRPWLAALSSLALISVLVAAASGALAPEDALQGEWQRLMYVHVPAAWVAYACFVVVAVASAMHLRRRTPGSSRVARAAGEVGVTATAVTLASGSVWGHAVWGVWWAWDPRLVSTALLGLVYLGVLVLGADGAPAARRASAWLGVAGLALIPVVHFSVTWWRSLHQDATILGPTITAPPLDARMAAALAVSVLAASLVAVLAVAVRLDRLSANGAASAGPRRVTADEVEAPATAPAS